MNRFLTLAQQRERGRLELNPKPLREEVERPEWRPSERGKPLVRWRKWLEDEGEFEKWWDKDYTEEDKEYERKRKLRDEWEEERDKRWVDVIKPRRKAGLPTETASGYFYAGLDLSGRETEPTGYPHITRYGARRRGKRGLNDKVETLTYKTPKGIKYFFYDKETKKLWETSGSEYRRLLKLRNYDPDDPKLQRRQRKNLAKIRERRMWNMSSMGNTSGGRTGDIREFNVRPATMEDLKILEGKLSTIVKREGKKDPKRRSISVNKPLTERGMYGTGDNWKRFPANVRVSNLRPRTRDRRKPDRPTRGRGLGKGFDIKVEARGKEGDEEVAKFKQSAGLGQYEDAPYSEKGVYPYNIYAPPVFRRTGGRRGFRDTERFDPTPSSQLSMRGLRDPRTAGGNILRGSRTRMGFKTRYQSALEQAIIDRRIRNTIAENKLEEEIKKVKDGEKLKLDNMRLLKETADQTLDALKLKNQKLLHDHNVVVRGNQNATLLGSDAEELNKLITSGRLSYVGIKDMVRKGEISDIATIHQLDFHKGRDQKIKKLVSLMEETADYQVNKPYPFREVNEDGTISILSGFYQKGGERGTNLQLLMPDGSRKIVRKRDLLDPNDPRLDNLQPITANAPTIDVMSHLSEDSIDSHIELGVRPAQNPSSDMWLGTSLAGSGIGEGYGEGLTGGGGRPIKTPSISSSSEDIFGEDEPTPKPEVEEPKPDLAVAQYNKILETMGQREAFQRARESELRTLEIPELKEGILGFGGNAKEVERITQRRKQVEDHIRREAKTIKLQKKKANSIAVEKGFEIPFVEGGEDIIPARALLKSMTGESPLPDVSQEQFAQSVEQLRKVQMETGEITEEEEEELEELQPEPEPQISTGDISLVPFDPSDIEAENTARSEFVKDLQTDDGRNYKIEYMGYPLIIDSQRDEVIDPAGKLPILPLNIFSSPTGNFIKWESETQKIGIETLIREAQKPPPEPKPEVGDEKIIGWDRNEVKPSMLKKFAEQNRPNSESMMIWSTRFPDERDTPKKAVFITRDQLEAKLNTLDLGKKERENFLAKFDAEKGKGKTEFAMNNRKIWKGLGLEGTPSASSIVDYRTSVLQLDP